MTYATLKYELSDGIATVTINRPEKNNAISMEMRADFRALADELYGNEAVRVAVEMAKLRAKVRAKLGQG